MAQVYKPFKEQKHFTVFDNVILDHIMPRVSPAAFCVLALVVRKTAGWHKEQDQISQSQIIAGTGINSVNTVKRAVNELEQLGILHVGEHTATTAKAYQLNLDFELELPEVYQKLIEGVSKIDRGGVSKIDITKETIKNKKEKKESSARSARTRTTKADQARMAYMQLRNLWCEHFPDKAQPRSDNRTLENKMRVRLKSQHFADNWRAALERAHKSSFLQNSSWFDVGWFLQNDDHYERCLNGKYDDNDVRSNGVAPALPDPEDPEVMARVAAQNKQADAVLDKMIRGEM